ncbi:MAG: polyamine aminopropyltransferase [Clostridia bacterium]|nr:polyamine aminopropyltransferase [Clostridia bacterium]
MTDLWFHEDHSEGVRFQIKIDKHLCSLHSEFQRLDIFETVELGKMLVLDGILMITEKDEFVYHEMMVHVPMAVNPDIKSVLVIGAGDGGTVKRLTEYKGIEKIVVAEIDKLVVDKCKQFFPDLTVGFDDKRVKLVYEDGLKYVRNFEGAFDLIIVDSTDPFGPGEGLFTREFYGNCHKALGVNGILVNQHESPFYDSYKDTVTKTHEKLKAFFPICQVYQAHIPTYPSGHWLFGFSSKKYDGTDIKKEKWEENKIACQYYNTDLHKGAFALPNYTKELLR